MYLGSYHHRSINYVISSQLIDTANAFTRNPEKSISGNESHGRVSICQCFLVIHAKAWVLIKTKQTEKHYQVFSDFCFRKPYHMQHQWYVTSVCQATSYHIDKCCCRYTCELTSLKDQDIDRFIPLHCFSLFFHFDSMARKYWENTAFRAYEAHKHHTLICILASPTRQPSYWFCILIPCSNRKHIAFKDK